MYVRLSLNWPVSTNAEKPTSGEVRLTDGPRGDNAMNSLGRERSFHLVEEGYAEASRRVHSVSFPSTQTPLETTDMLPVLII